MPKVGIVANPASGKDIRRLVAYGTVFDNQEKVNIVKRLLLSMAAAGVQQVMYMPDYYGIVPRAVEGIYGRHKLDIEVIAAAIDLTGTQVDTYHAAVAMEQAKVDCIVSLGGDGTNRMIAKGCGQTPLLPISTGTNNVFPFMIEGTIAGLAAGVVASGVVTGSPAVQPTKKLVVYKNGKPVDIALIDAVVMKDSFIGARAVWEMNRAVKIFVTRGEAHNIGMSAIAGNLVPVGIKEQCGLVVEIGTGGVMVAAPIAPGLIKEVPIQSYRHLNIDEEIEIINVPCIIALDGEREVEVGKEEKVSIKLTFQGPNVIDVEAALREAVASRG